MKIIFTSITVLFLKFLSGCTSEPYLDISAHEGGFIVDFNNEESYFYEAQWTSKFVIEIHEYYRLVNDPMGIPIYMLCPNGSINQVFANDILEPSCILSASKSNEKFYTTYYQNYKKYLSQESEFLDSLFVKESQSLSPDMNEYEMLVFWTKKVHEHLSYDAQWNPFTINRTLDEIFLSGQGDCEDFVLAIDYLLDKAGIEAHPVLVTASLYRVLNVWSPQLRYDHLAIRLPQTGVIADVSDNELIAKTHLLMAGFPALDLVDQKEYIIPSLETFSLSVNTNRYEVLYSAFGADDLLYGFANKILSNKSLDFYFEDIYKGYNVENYSNSASIEPYHTTVDISFDLQVKNSEGGVDQLPLDVGFAPILKTFDTDRGVSCYIGSDRLVKINTPKLKIDHQPNLLRNMGNENVKWESYFDDEGALVIELVRLSKDGCNFSDTEISSEKVINHLNEFYKEIELDI